MASAEIQRAAPCFHAQHLDRLGLGPDARIDLDRARRETNLRRRPRLVARAFIGTDSFAVDKDGRLVVVQGYSWLPRQAITGAPFETVTLLHDYIFLLNSRIFFALLRENGRIVSGGQVDGAKNQVRRVPLPDLAAMYLETPELEVQGRVLRELDAQRAPDRAVARCVRSCGVPHPNRRVVALMSRSLVRSQRVVESRLRILGQRFNAELGFRDQRLHFAKRSMRQGSITWVLINQNLGSTHTMLPQGSVAELASAGSDESVLYFGYNEEWQPAQGRDQIEFTSSNLRFVISSVDDMPVLRFRLEWAGAKTAGSDIAYPGVGAAHPHWQFDVDSYWQVPAAMPVPALNVEEASFEIDLEPRVEEIDLGTSAAADALVPRSPPSITATLASFHRLHLPARAMWHELECIMPEVAAPQQHTPQSEIEIDNWLISALRYLKHEFETYM